MDRLEFHINIRCGNLLQQTINNLENGKALRKSLFFVWTRKGTFEFLTAAETSIMVIWVQGSLKMVICSSGTFITT
jgi:hypothetical protein